MLTKNDLSQIRRVVRSVLHSEATQIVRKETVSIVRRELNPIKKTLHKMQKDIDAIISFLDRQELNIRKRLERLEENLGLSPIQ